MPSAEFTERPTASRRVAVIVCAELRNFTRLSEVLEPEVVLRLTGEFFSVAAGAVATEGGRIVTLHNDGLASLFSSERPTEFAVRAVNAAQAMQREFDPLGERWRTEYGLPAALALGLHVGEVVTGMTGPAHAEQFVAFGDNVSIAERLMHRARAGEMVLSGVLMKLLGGAGQALGAQALPPLELARRAAVPLYGVLRDTRLDFT